MTILQIVALIGIGIIFIGAMFLCIEHIKTGIILMIIGVVVGITGATSRQAELDKNIPTALDVYRGKTTLEITYREAQTIERKWGIVNFKNEEDKVACGEAIRRMYQLEEEVDGYLKKFNENI